MLQPFTQSDNFRHQNCRWNRHRRVYKYSDRINRKHTLYYVRAYATNSIGTVYGNEKTFATTSLPTVYTTEITDIAQYTALGGGHVQSAGFANVTARGVCWSTAQNPTIANSHTNDGSGTGPFVSNITGLTANTLYYIRAYATNSIGTSYGNQLIFTTLSSPFFIGQPFGGGIIFYIDPTGLHGLISAGLDQSNGVGWGCYQTLIGGTTTTIGTGQANTTSIVTICTYTNIAARLCDDLVLNGKSDWYLPSKDELNQLYIHRVEVGGFNTTYNTDQYWSSSEADATHSWSQTFDLGVQSAVLKGPIGKVRAVRTF